MLHLFNSRYCTLLLCILFTSQLYGQSQSARESSSEILEKSLLLYGNGSYEEAIESYLKIHPNDSNYWIALDEITLSYIGMEEYEKALEYSNKLERLGHASIASYYINRAVAQERLDSIEQAVDTYNQGLELFPYNHILHYNLALTFFNQKRYREAYQAAVHSLQSNPIHRGTHILLGQLELNQGHYAKAVISMEMGIMVAPGNEANKQVLATLEELSRQGFSIGEKEGFENISKNTGFEQVDLLLKSKTALSKKYKSQAKIEASVIRQTQLLMEQLDNLPAKGDVWVEVYAPMFHKIYTSDLFNTYVHVMLASINTPEVNKGLKKVDKNIAPLYSLMRASWEGVYPDRQVEVGEEKFTLPSWYDNESYQIIALGEMENEEKEGYWRFFHPTGYMASEGWYKAGKATGTWRVYDEYGILTQQYEAKNNQLAGKYQSYKNGLKYTEGETDDESNVIGNLHFFYPCGILEEEIPHENGERNGESTIYYITGKKKASYTYMNGKLNGVAKTFYVDGQVSKVWNYKDNEYDGEYKVYHRNGKLSIEGNYKLDKEFGPWKIYNEEGVLMKEMTFDEQGKEYGKTISYFASGKPSEVTQMVNGAPEGEQVLYDETTGKPFVKTVFTSSGITSITYFNEKGEVFKETKGDKSFEAQGYDIRGRLLYEGWYTDKKRDNNWTFYYPSGEISSTVRYDLGKKDGQEMHYYPTGEMKFMITYNDGIEQGVWTEYYPNEQVKKRGWFEGGERDGEWLEYHPHGALAGKTYWVDGERAGMQYAYAVDGTLRTANEVKNGLSISNVSYNQEGKFLKEVKTPDGSGDYQLFHITGELNAEGKRLCDIGIGDFKWFNPNGQVSVQFSYDDEGLWDGDYKRYNAAGIMVADGEYEHGTATGLWKFYDDEDGKLSAEVKYENNEREGKYIAYFNGGQISDVRYYKAGKKNGIAQEYNREGQLMGELDYEDGMVVRFRSPMANSQMTDWAKLNIQGEGLIKTYYENGQLAMEVVTKNGYFHGMEKLYYADGKAMTILSHEGGEWNGEYITYYPNGKARASGSYLYGKKHGVYKSYREDGTLKYEQEFLFGEAHGYKKIYNEQGELAKEEIYWNDYLLK